MSNPVNQCPAPVNQRPPPVNQRPPPVRCSNGAGGVRPWACCLPAGRVWARHRQVHQGQDEDCWGRGAATEEGVAPVVMFIPWKNCLTPYNKCIFECCLDPPDTQTSRTGDRCDFSTGVRLSCATTNCYLP